MDDEIRLLCRPTVVCLMRRHTRCRRYYHQRQHYQSDAFARKVHWSGPIDKMAPAPRGFATRQEDPTVIQWMQKNVKPLPKSDDATLTMLAATAAAAAVAVAARC